MTGRPGPRASDSGRGDRHEPEQDLTRRDLGLNGPSAHVCIQGRPSGAALRVAGHRTARTKQAARWLRARRRSVQTPRRHRAADVRMLSTTPHVPLSACDFDEAWLSGTIRCRSTAAARTAPPQPRLRRAAPHEPSLHRHGCAVLQRRRPRHRQPVQQPPWVPAVHRRRPQRGSGPGPGDHRGPAAPEPSTAHGLQRIIGDFTADPDAIIRAIGECGQPLADDGDRYGSGDVARTWTTYGVRSATTRSASTASRTPERSCRRTRPGSPSTCARSSSTPASRPRPRARVDLGRRHSSGVRRDRRAATAGVRRPATGRSPTRAPPCPARGRGRRHPVQRTRRRPWTRRPSRRGRRVRPDLDRRRPPQPG